MSGPARIEQMLSFHLGQARAASNRRFAEMAAALGITHKQASALWLVGDHPGIAQVDLGQRLQMDRATTMGVVNRLEQRGLIRREKSVSDARKQALYLEPLGETALRSAQQALREHDLWLSRRLTAAERDVLVDLLARLHQ